MHDNDGPGSAVHQTCQQLKTLVFDCIEELCGGKAAHEWKQETYKLVSSTISLTSKSGGIHGKPWEIEIRTPQSYYHRFKNRESGILVIESDLGLIRTVSSMQEFGRLMLLTLEESTRRTGLALDIRCNHAGILCVTTHGRLLMLRELGRLPCPYCCQWPKGDKGLWWHIQQAHATNHSSAMATTANTVSTNAIVLYHPSEPHHGRFAAIQRPRSILSQPVEIATMGDVHAMRELLQQGFNPSSYIDNKGASLLLWAAGAGHLAMVELLIECGCDPNFAQQGKRGFQGRTALHWAARGGHLGVVRYLVEDQGVFLEAKTADGTTAFCWAAWQGHENILKYLYSQGCDVSSVNSFGCNAALWAAQGNGLPDLIDWLDAVGCSCLVLNDNCHGVLHKAAQRGKSALIDWFLLGKLLDVSDPLLALEMIRPDIDGCMPSDLAGMEGHEALAGVLARKEVAVLDKALGLKHDKLPGWLMNMSLSSAESVWEPWAGVKRLRVAVTIHRTLES